MAEIETRCKHCGKPIAVLEPSRWEYKVKNTKKGGWTYYCTWKCLRADEKKEPKQVVIREEEKPKDEKVNRLQILEDMLDAVSDGRNAYDYLKDMGYTDPKDTLRRLRIKAKKEAPEIYKKMEKLGLRDMRKGNSGRKGVDKMSQNKLTREQKEKAVQLALNGGDYLAHLGKCGSKNPSAAWWYIKKTLAKNNSKLLAEVMKKTGEVETVKAQEVVAAVEIAEKLPPEAVAEVPEEDQLAGFVAYDPGAPEGDKTAYQGDEAAAFLEAANVFTTIMNPNGKKDKFDGFQVTAVNGKFGQYRVGIDPSSKQAYFDFDGLDFDTQIRMPQHDLAAFVEELTRAAQILGVAAG